MICLMIHLVLGRLAVIFSDIFTVGQCLYKILPGIVKMENKYRVGMWCHHRAAGESGKFIFN